MLPPEFYRDHHNDARMYLADQLRRGSLALFLGAGVSKPLGLPAWKSLVTKCLMAAGIDPEPDMLKDAQAMRTAMDRVESGRPFHEYAQLVSAALYDGMSITEELVGHRLLIALGALTMSSRRGSIRTVVTLNFDDVLERYWYIHGYSSQVVSALPALLRETDVTIYHPNGFLPSSDEWSASDFVVLSESSFDRRLSLFETEWRALVTDILMSRIGLFIGLSGDDPIIGPTLYDVKTKIGSKRMTGFWMRGPSPERGDDYFLTRNVVPLNFGTFDEYPSFLFSICQAAAAQST
jgi:hypothetical protein